MYVYIYIYNSVLTGEVTRNAAEVCAFCNEKLVR